MIIKNKDKIYAYIKESLKWDHRYTESTEREYFLELILRRMENIDIYYINSWRARNSIKILDDAAVIIWDFNFWIYYEKYLVQINNCIINNKNMIQAVICLMTSFLAKKYQDVFKLSSFLEQIEKEYSSTVQCQQGYFKKLKAVVCISKIFALYHEIGHLNQKQNNIKEVKKYQDMLIDLFRGISNYSLTYLGNWEELAKRVASDINKGNNKGKDILEEVVSDIYAVVQTIKLYKELFNIDHFQAINECMQAYEYISGFQHMFSTINLAWENHNVEIKFGLPLRYHVLDNYINELGVARNEIGGHIILFVLKIIYHLKEKDVLQIVDNMDKCYINNASVINCLADEQFIYTAIQDALS